MDRARLDADALAAGLYLEAFARLSAEDRPLSAAHERVVALAERLCPTRAVRTEGRCTPTPYDGASCRSRSASVVSNTSCSGARRVASSPITA
jgi:hypothetical protein